MSWPRYSNIFECSIHPPDDERLNSQGFAVPFLQVDHLILPNLPTSIPFSRRNYNGLHPDIRVAVLPDTTAQAAP
jgi:hypothetical protein